MASEEEEIDIPDNHIYNPPLGKLQRFLNYWRNGRRDHFPICCVLRFAIENALRDGKMVPIEEGSAEKRGVVNRGNDDVFVPCNLFHHKTEDA